MMNGAAWRMMKELNSDAMTDPNGSSDAALQQARPPGTREIRERVSFLQRWPGGANLGQALTSAAYRVAINRQ